MGFEVDGTTTYVAFGSGFVVRIAQERPFLITAWHNLSGRHNETGELTDKETCCIPNRVEIHGLYDRIVQNLYDGENDPSKDAPLYWRHPAGPQIDVTALPIHQHSWVLEKG